MVPPMKRSTFAEVLNQAQRGEMRRHPLVLVLGKDVDRWGGVFRVTRGLLKVFGPERVIDTPVSESAIAGRSTSSSVSQLVDPDRIQQLLLNGRNVLQLIALTPGVVYVGSLGQFEATQASFVIGGGHQVDTIFISTADTT